MERARHARKDCDERSYWRRRAWGDPGCDGGARNPTVTQRKTVDERLRPGHTWRLWLWSSCQASWVTWSVPAALQWIAITAAIGAGRRGAIAAAAMEAKILQGPG